MTAKPKVAIIHDWLVEYGGAEKVLQALLELYPDAPVHTLVYDPDGPCGPVTSGHRVETSFIQKLPRAKRRYRSYLPLFPLAIEQFDLRGYDIVISLSYSVAHGVLPQPDQLHINYICSPARYAWRLYHQYLQETGLTRGLKAWMVKATLHYLRLWDALAMNRVDHVVAISSWVAQNVWRVYRRPAEVLYPPVEVDVFTTQGDKDEYYLTASRLVPYKRLDLIVEAFARLPDKKLVVIGDGPEMRKLRELAGENVELLGYQPFEVLRDYLQRARAFVFAAEEDFGIAPVEAQACGTPVIAYGRGGVLETVLPGRTGLFFDQQTPEPLVAAIQAFEDQRGMLDLQAMRQNAERFSKPRFQLEFGRMVEREWEAFNTRESMRQAEGVIMRHGGGW